ncbi:MAG: HPr family phosphocarrier protein [Alphaproteobacteria bacterium]|nr:HPr family phosphocarrier protein [Alphaproteobacteria bacterium]
MDEAQHSGGSLCEMVLVSNQRGLHARAAAKFVKLAGGFKATIEVTKGDVRVSGCSIMGLMMLAAARGTTLKVCAEGAEAQQAITALVDLVKRKFDEE